MPAFAGMAVNVTGVKGQILLTEETMFNVGVMVAVTIIAMALEFAVVVLLQELGLVRTQEITSPFRIPVVEYVELFKPTFIPFIFHWYDGFIPPFTGVAAKVTNVPVHILLADAVMLTDGITGELTVIEIEFELTVAVVTHT